MLIRFGMLLLAAGLALVIAACAASPPLASAMATEEAAVAATQAAVPTTQAVTDIIEDAARKGNENIQSIAEKIRKLLHQPDNDKRTVVVMLKNGYLIMIGNTTVYMPKYNPSGDNSNIP